MLNVFSLQNFTFLTLDRWMDFLLWNNEAPGGTGASNGRQLCPEVAESIPLD